jgi:hypothetical protein
VTPLTTPALAAMTVAINAASAIVSVSERMPAEFGKGVLGRLAVVGDRRHVLRDFLTWKGTAMAPPLPMVVGLAAFAAAARRSEAAGVGIGVVGAAGLVGHLGEPFTWRVLAGRESPGRSALLLASIGLYAAMAATAWRTRAAIAATVEASA